MTMSTPRTVAQTVAAIEALDLSLIKFKATRTEDGYGWSPQYADQMEIAYKRYLVLHAKYPELMLAPDQDTDRFWHMHILDTRKYAADCEATFGEFLHHFPYLGLRGEDDEKALASAFDQMQQLYLREFGETQASQRDAAWCGVEPTGDKAAWCGVEPNGVKAAWCGVEPTGAKAAWCGVEPTAKAKPAWCGVEPTSVKAAWCGVEPTMKAAWCGVEPGTKAAWCGVEPTTKKEVTEAA
jgi:hypothetical protein